MIGVIDQNHKLLITCYAYCLFMAIYTAPAVGQSGTATISGTITDSTGVPLAGIAVSLAEIGTYTDADGQYALTNLGPGSYTLVISAVGYQKQSLAIALVAGQALTHDAALAEEVFSIQETIVEGTSATEQLRQRGYAVSVIESERQKNLTSDVNAVLKSIPGINLRQTGGLGSGFKLSLNGLSGNQIRYFIDGVPMENFGAALSLDNYPVNLVDKIEVYKGVVPVSLGADALGGAVNIVTDLQQRSFLDVALAHGSFATRRASFNGQYAGEGLFLKVASFYNHADNDYWMDDSPVHDLELGNALGAIRTRRFQDYFTSAMVHGEAGLFAKKRADRLSLGVIAAASRKDYQHPDNNINRVFGEFHVTNSTVLSSINYGNRFDDNLALKLFAISGRIATNVVDTSTRKYNWTGDSIERAPDDPKGELAERRSSLELSDWILRSSIGTDYSIAEQHSLSLNATQSYLRRTGEDAVDRFNRSFESPNYIHKNLLGLAYNYGHADAFEATVFGKRYWYAGRIVTQDYQNNDITTRTKLDATGYGLAVSYRPTANIQLKSSFERAYRVPESFEILGDGIYIHPNPALQPETSRNFNLGWRLTPHLVEAEANFFYRFSEDFIRFNPLGPFGKYENLEDVRTVGVEGEIDTNYRDLVAVNANITYQSLTDQTRFDEGLPNANYRSRIPNVPHLFANTRIGLSHNRQWHFYWSIHFVEAFFLLWENLGNRDHKNIIPRQLTHDFETEYALNGGRYNASLTVNNLTNARVYDHFNIQKPGRSMHIKIRYSLK